MSTTGVDSSAYIEDGEMEMPPRYAGLRRFWFRTNPGYGIGVTAYTEAEAEGLAREVAAQFEQKILDVTPDVDIQTLDQGHVIPTPGSPSSCRGCGSSTSATLRCGLSSISRRPDGPTRQHRAIVHGREEHRCLAAYLLGVRN